MLEKYEKAGKIASKIRKQAVKKAVAGTKVIDLIDFIESEIKGTGAGLSFPCNISINQIAAHYTSPLNDQTILCNGDIVKIDLGAEVDGYISDTAETVIVEGDNIEPIDEDGNQLYMPGRLDDGINEITQEEIELRENINEASKLALENVASILREGVTLNEIGKTVNDTISNKGFSPIYDLAGHSLEQNNLHAGLSIPNYADGSTYKLKEGDHVAIEPFATNGTGFTKELSDKFIYSYIQQKPIRQKDAYKLLKNIKNNNQYFPFAQRHLNNYNIARFERNMNHLVRAGSVYAHSVLIEETNAMVAQTEHTFIIEKDGCQITTL